MNDHDNFVKSKSGKLVVIDFHATYCGPCHAIAPKYESFSNTYRGSAFAKVDVDQGKDIAAKYSVSAMPTFVFLKNGVKVDEVKGANASAIEAAIKRHGDGAAGGSSGSFSGAGRTLGGKVIEAPKPPSNLPDLKVVVAVVAIIGLWWYYGGDGMAPPPEMAGMSPF